MASEDFFADRPFEMVEYVGGFEPYSCGVSGIFLREWTFRYLDDSEDEVLSLYTRDNEIKVDGATYRWSDPNDLDCEMNINEEKDYVQSGFVAGNGTPNR